MKFFYFVPGLVMAYLSTIVFIEKHEDKVIFNFAPKSIVVFYRDFILFVF